MAQESKRQRSAKQGVSKCNVIFFLRQRLIIIFIDYFLRYNGNVVFVHLNRNFFYLYFLSFFLHFLYSVF